jgi:uncharacterized protein YggU (UPF0235/DUF167 family)
VSSDFVVPRDGGAFVSLRASPGSKHTEPQDPYGAAVWLRVAAPPVDGKANAGVERGHSSRGIGAGRVREDFAAPNRR